jgi:hypothetical protein
MQASVASSNNCYVYDLLLCDYFFHNNFFRILLDEERSNTGFILRTLREAILCAFSSRGSDAEERLVVFFCPNLLPVTPL